VGVVVDVVEVAVDSQAAVDVVVLVEAAVSAEAAEEAVLEDEELVDVVVAVAVEAAAVAADPEALKAVKKLLSSHIVMLEFSLLVAKKMPLLP